MLTLTTVYNYTVCLYMYTSFIFHVVLPERPLPSVFDCVYVMYDTLGLVIIQCIHQFEHCQIETVCFYVIDARYCDVIILFCCWLL